MGKKPLERGDGFIQVIKTGQVDMQRGSGSNSAILIEWMNRVHVTLYHRNAPGPNLSYLLTYLLVSKPTSH